ncbi:hypothetical protein DH2020_021538 [Rehmannia glutinosa]|uniref:Tf2-1-like SH3-like domain-containing protein n=1 Tax=Rehmannia glutinosa TaxID=99300 RepID=A0ABR0WB81_REHGL
MAPYEALYGRKCRSPIHWDEVGEKKVLGPDIVKRTIEVVEKIRERIKAAQDRQKSYADPKRKELQFAVGEKVFLRVSPTKGIFRFGKRGKLNPRNVGPYEVLERVGRVAYRLALHQECRIHNVFHVSMLRRYMPDPSHVVNYETIKLDKQLSYEKKPVAVLDRKVHKLRNRDVELIKMQWSGHSQEEATWERKEDILASHPEVQSLLGTFKFRGRNYF